MICLTITPAKAQESQAKLPVPTGTPSVSQTLSKIMGATEFVNGEVLKIYSAEDQGAKYLAYVVKYKGREVVVSDLMHTASLKQPGDKITFVAQRLGLPSVGGGTNQILQFTVMK